MERRRILAVAAAALPLAIAGAVAALRDRGAPAPAAPAPPPPAPAPVPSDPTPSPTDDTGAEPGPAPAPEGLDILCRDALGLVPALAGGVAHETVRVTVHHSAFLLEDSADAPRQLRAFQRDHQRRGWVDVAYHRAVDPAGNVYELRDPDVEGDSGTDYDTTGHLQLLCLGDYDQQEPTPALLETLARLIAAECAARDLPLATLSAHRDHVLTWCPGGALYARLEEVRARAAELLAAGAPVLRPFCGDEGSARVAAIETGT